MLRESILWTGLILALMALSLWSARGRLFAQGKPAPEISGGSWLNSQPLTIDGLKGQVVLVEFWTYG